MSSWNEFCQGVKKTAFHAADKIGQSVDLATLQVKLSVAEGKLDEAYTALGHLAYSRFAEQEITEENIKAAMDNVEENIKACEALKARIAKVKDPKEGKKAEQ